MKSKKSENKFKTSNKCGNLLVVSGPSGAGKGTVVSRLLQVDDKIKLSVSATTRAPRTGEKDGVSYFFVSETEFLQMINDDELLEYDKHFNNYYGTPKKYVLEMMQKGYDVLLEIDIAGAMLIKQKYPEAMLFFITAPSVDELKRRLMSRNTETPDQLEIRLGRVEKEFSYQKQYDYTVINDTVDNAVEQIRDIIKEMR